MSSLCIGEAEGLPGGQFSWSDQELAPMKAVGCSFRPTIPWKSSGNEFVLDKMCSLCVNATMELQCLLCFLTRARMYAATSTMDTDAIMVYLFFLLS